MLYRISPGLIFRHHFSVVDTKGIRRFSFVQLLLHGLLPAAIGCAAGFLSGPLTSVTSIGMVIAVFSLVATVLTAMISVIYAVLAGDSRPLPTRDQPFLKDNELARLAAIRSLQSNVAFCVIVLLASILPSILLLATLPFWIAHTITLVVFSVAAMVALSMIDILVGVYDVLENEAEERAKDIRNA